jgi:hypothetical protein
MFAQEKLTTDRPSGLIRKRIEPLVAATSGFRLMNIGNS